MKTAIWDTMEWNNSRWNVYRDDWDQLLNRFKNMVSCDITLRKLSLGARDSTTGWRAKSFTESTIEGMFVTKAMTPSNLSPGLYVKYDGLVKTADGVAEGNEIKDPFGNYWEVKAAEGACYGDNFVYRDCHLTKMPLHT